MWQTKSDSLSLWVIDSNGLNSPQHFFYCLELESKVPFWHMCRLLEKGKKEKEQVTGSFTLKINILLMIPVCCVLIRTRHIRHAWSFDRCDHFQACSGDVSKQRKMLPTQRVQGEQMEKQAESCKGGNRFFMQSRSLSSFSCGSTKEWGHAMTHTAQQFLTIDSEAGIDLKKLLFVDGC